MPPKAIRAATASTSPLAICPGSTGVALMPQNTRRHLKPLMTV